MTSAGFQIPFYCYLNCVLLINPHLKVDMLNFTSFYGITAYVLVELSLLALDLFNTDI